MRKFIFRNQLNWQNTHPTSYENKKKFKNHNIQIEGKPTLNLSAAPEFKGDALLHNPEDLLLSSVSSCHMMSFLYICQLKQIEVLAYTDEGEANLAVTPTGAGHIEYVLLKPKVVFQEVLTKEQVKALHQEAHELCFIARSVAFPITIEPIS